MKFWWAVRTSTGREFYVKGGGNFNVDGRREAEDRLDPGESLVIWFRAGAVCG